MDTRPSAYARYVPSRPDIAVCRRARHAVCAAVAGAIWVVLVSPTLNSRSAALLPVARCSADALRLRIGGVIVPKTQQTPLLLALVKRGAKTCTLDGYPRIRLESNVGSPYPFAYRDRGDQEVTHAAPLRIVLRPGTSAWVMINKNHCELHTSLGQGVVDRLALSPPGSTAFLRIKLGSRQPAFNYCDGPDPGHYVDVSPLESSAGAA
jgi:hypothetical protein